MFEHDLFGKPVPTFPDHALTEATAFLDHFDLVAIGIGDEEKARERRAIMPYRQANAETRAVIISYLKGLN